MLRKNPNQLIDALNAAIGMNTTRIVQKQETVKALCSEVAKTQNDIMILEQQNIDWKDIIDNQIKK